MILLMDLVQEEEQQILNYLKNFQVIMCQDKVLMFNNNKILKYLYIKQHSNKKLIEYMVVMMKM